MVAASRSRTGMLLTVLFLGVPLFEQAQFLYAGFMPTDLAGLQIWVDAGDPYNTGAAPAPGTPISAWADKSGAGHHLVQGAGDPSRYPTYQGSGIGGRPSIRFDGNDYLWATTYDSANPYTVFAVGNMQGSQNYRLVSSHNINWLLGYWGGQEQVLHANAWVTYPGPAANTTPDLYAATNTGAANRLYYNGADITGNPAAGLGRIGQLSLGGAYLGGSEFSRGDVAEVVMYDRVLSAAELNQVGYYLSRKYGLPSSYTGPPPSSILTWDGGTGNWGDSTHWDAPPAIPNNDTIRAVVASGDVTVGASCTAHSLQQAGGQVTVGANRTLTLAYGMSATGGTVALQDQSRLVLDMESGSIGTLSVLGGDALVHAEYGTLSVANVNLASSLTKTGMAAMAVQNASLAAGSSFVAGGGTVTLQSVVAAAGSTFDAHAGTLQAAPAPNYIDQGDLVLSGGTFQASGSVVELTTNALKQYGYHVNNDALMMNLNNNGGMVGGTPPNPPSVAGFYGQSFLTAGPGNRGLDFDNDADFIAQGMVNQADNYSNLFLGKLVVPADKAGTWNFRIEAQDDPCGMWIDLNRNGVFESNGALNSNQGEQLAWSDTGTKSVALAAGEYWVAFTHREGGGGSAIDINFSAPGISDRTVMPLDAAQNGLWNWSIRGAIDMGSSDVTVAAGTTGSRIEFSTDQQATFGNLAFGRDSDLSVSGSKAVFPRILTNGDASLGLSGTVIANGYDDQGAPATMRLYGSGTLAVVAAAPGDVSAKVTNFQVDTGATFRVAGAGLLGGDPLVTLNGGTFTVAPPTSLPTYPNAYMQLTDVNVLASSTLNSLTAGTLALGHLGFDGPSILTVAGSGGQVDFVDTTVRAAGTSGFSTAVSTIGRSLDANGLAVTFAKQGASDLIFTRGGAGLGSTTLDVQAGTLALIGANTAAGAAIRMSGGNLTLGSPDGTDQTFDNTITSTGSGTITAGSRGGYGAASGDIAIPSLTPGAGTTVTLAAEGTHRIVLPNGVNAPGSSLHITQGEVLVQNAVTVGGLSGTGGTLATDGTFAISPQTALQLGSQLRVNSGNLTLNLPNTPSLPSGTVAFYNFSGGSVSDGSGLGHNGSLVGNAQIVGDALVVDGNTAGGGYANLPSMADHFTNAGTVTMWVKLDLATPTDGARTGLVGLGGSGNNHYPWTDGQAYSTVLRADGNRVNNIALSGAIDRAAWHLVTFTSDPAGGWNMYQNTTLVRNAAAVWGINNWTLGKDVSNAYLDGQLDNVMVLNRAITPAEIAQLYAAGPTATYGGATLGDVRLADGASLTLAGAAQPQVNSIGATSNGPVATGPMTLSNFGNPTAARTGSTVTLDATITTANFAVTGSGTLALAQNLTLTSGSLTSSSTANLATLGSLTIAAQAAGTVDLNGQLGVVGGTLTVNTPATASLGQLVLASGTGLVLGGTGAASFDSISAADGTSIQGAATLVGGMTLGASPGTLNVTGSFTMAAGSTYHWEHDGTNQDLVAVTGSVNVNSAWTLGITLGGIIGNGSYDLFTHTMGSTPPVGAVNILKENSWAQLISSATVWDVGPGETASFPTKWMSADGKTVHLVFSGDDCFSVRKATLAVATE